MVGISFGIQTIEEWISFKKFQRWPIRQNIERERVCKTFNFKLSLISHHCTIRVYITIKTYYMLNSKKYIGTEQ